MAKYIYISQLEDWLKGQLENTRYAADPFSAGASIGYEKTLDFLKTLKTRNIRQVLKERSQTPEGRASYERVAEEMRKKMNNNWISVEEKPLQVGIEVIGYNPGWIDEDFNPNGTRIGSLMDGIGFCSATWNAEHDVYDTVYEEGDDYYKGNAFVIEQEKKNYRPNMPTHYIFIPKHP